MNYKIIGEKKQTTEALNLGSLGRASGSASSGPVRLDVPEDAAFRNDPGVSGLTYFFTY